jgi:hypothetical protein
MKKLNKALPKEMDRKPERDWKYLRSIKDELIEVLCARINGEATRIATDASVSQHECFLRLDRHLGKGNEIVAECFDDWMRSTWLSRASAETRRSQF